MLEGLNIRKVLEESNLPIEIASAIADRCERVPEGRQGQWSMDVGLSMVRDAERYRFLRTSINCKEFRGSRSGPERLAAEALDAAVDRAMESMNPLPPKEG